MFQVSPGYNVRLCLKTKQADFQKQKLNQSGYQAALGEFTFSTNSKAPN